MPKPKLTKTEWREIRNRQERADERAAAVLAQLGVTEAPVDPLSVAASEAPLLRAKGGDFGGAFDGMLEYRRRGYFLLLYNEKYDRLALAGGRHPRTRFSIAHELGHYFLEEHHAYLRRGGRPHASRSEFTSPLMVEREADAFAAGLLMPRRIIAPIVSRSELTLARVEAMAERFGTSLTSTARRAAELSHFPSAVVSVSNGNLGMCTVSQSLIDAGCYPRPSGAALPPTAQRAWAEFASGGRAKLQDESSVGDWFQTYDADHLRDVPVCEHYLPIPVTNSLLVILGVPEDELYQDDDDQ